MYYWKFIIRYKQCLLSIETVLFDRLLTQFRNNQCLRLLGRKIIKFLFVKDSRRRMRWAGHVARGVYKVLVGKPEAKRPLGRPRRRWEDNIKMDLHEVGRGLGTGWSWLRVGTGGGHLWVRWWTFGFHKMRGISWLAARPVSFLRRTLLHGVSK